MSYRSLAAYFMRVSLPFLCVFPFANGRAELTQLMAPPLGDPKTQGTFRKYIPQVRRDPELQADVCYAETSYRRDYHSR
jgi:hypothetical protein